MGSEFDGRAASKGSAAEAAAAASHIDGTDISPWIRDEVGPQEAKAIEIALVAHKGQLDKGGHPYIEHPATVASALEGDDLRAVGWLHDVVEDTEWTLDDLRAQGVDEHVVQAVDALTRRKADGETYREYIERVALNEMAVKVKIADLWHNSDPARWRRGMRLSLRQRYKRSLKRLGEDVSGYVDAPPFVD